jgi:hypothetical protein
MIPVRIDPRATFNGNLPHPRPRRIDLAEMPGGRCPLRLLKFIVDNTEQIDFIRIFSSGIA